MRRKPEPDNGFLDGFHVKHGSKMCRRSRDGPPIAISKGSWFFIGFSLRTCRGSETIWRKPDGEILAANHVAVFVTEADRVLVATTTLMTAPNLMRGGTPHGILENVVTHADHRRRGHGREAVEAGLSEAWARGCERALLVTGRMHLNPHVADFYEGCGFRSGRAGLMAQRPSA